MATIRLAHFGNGSDDAAICRTLMREYAAHLNAAAGGEHICIQSLEEELASLPGAYAAPAGAVLLAFEAAEPAGCVALKPLHLEEHRPGERACEMKRLWVRPGFQGRGVGRHLTEAVLRAALQREYTTIYLDTLPASMQAAYHIYLAMGFVRVPRYGENPVLRDTENGSIAWLRKELR